VTLNSRLFMDKGIVAFAFSRGVAGPAGKSDGRASVSLALQVALFAAVTVLLAAGVRAQGVTYHGCVNAQGQSVESVADPSMSGVARAGVENGRPVIRHNAAVLPQLTAQARLFFFAHECARHALAQPLDDVATLDDAQRADCWAIGALRASQTFADDHAERTLEAELNLSDEAWPSLTGPPRTFNFSACASRGVLRLPSQTPPTEAQLRADRCVQTCGDRLWQCQKRCRDDACRVSCEAAFDHCEAGCAAR
jgi:hypothetical protein